MSPVSSLVLEEHALKLALHREGHLPLHLVGVLPIRQPPSTLDATLVGPEAELRLLA